MNIAIWLERAGKAWGMAPAIGLGNRIVADYRSFAGDVACRAAGLAEYYHLTPGAHIGLVAKNAPDYLYALFSIWHAGLTAVPINVKLHGAEIGWILENAQCELCLVSSDMESEVSAHAPKSLRDIVVLGSSAWRKLLNASATNCVPRQSQDLAWLFYTSGTTGRPKGAMITHGMLAAASFAYLGEVDAVEPGNPILHAAPMSHGSGLYIMGHVLRGGVNVVPESGGFDPPEIAACFNHWRDMSMFAAPTMIKRMVASAADLHPEAIRTIIWGGAPMYVEDARKALDRFGPRFAQIYGQGESPMTITTLSRHEIADRQHPRWLERLGSAGRAYACMDVAVFDAENRSLPPGELGEIVCRGAAVMPGYWNNPQASAKALAGGWLHTGDIGTFDSDGYLTIKDRSKDMLISGGSNIYPREVEEALLTHAKVREVSVIGRPDPEWGEIVVAYVVGEACKAELDAHCLERIARFKRPKDYVFVEALPKNAYGKILKTELRNIDAKKMGEAP